MPQRIRAGCDGIFTRLPTTQTALPQRIRAGCDSSDRRRGSKDSSLPQRIRAGCDSMDPFTANNLGNFATAHSRGLIAIRQSMVFATAHSRGLRPAVVVNIHACDDLCHSAFARVATAACKQEEQDNPLCHSAFARVATAQCTAPCRFPSSLPQRIRAGCDLQVPPPLLPAWSLPQRIRAGCDLMLMPLAFADSLCHSAFVRVATPFGVSFQRAQTFATAHSRGLRRNKLINACNFVTLCHSAFARVAT